MKTIGLIGGLSWESSVEYYRIINQTAQRRLGGVSSAKSLMYTFNFAEIEALQHQGDWEAATRLMVEAGQNLKKGGADFLVICSNTMHRMAEQVESQVGLPLLHIADTTAKKIEEAGIKKVGLLGTIYTMEQTFYKGRLTDKYGLEVVVPGEAERQRVNRAIYDELVCGIINPQSLYDCREIIAGLVATGVQGIILGCTELMLLLKPEDSAVPIFDTTTIHAEVAVEYALS